MSVCDPHRRQSCGAGFLSFREVSFTPEIGIKGGQSSDSQKLERKLLKKFQNIVDNRMEGLYNIHCCTTENNKTQITMRGSVW